MDRKNINRGFKQLRVWQDPVSLYILSCKIFATFPFEFKKVAANCIDAAHSISRNISEGYCRRSLKEYLNHLNFALGSCGEFHSCIAAILAVHWLQFVAQYKRWIRPAVFENVRKALACRTPVLGCHNDLEGSYGYRSSYPPHP